MGLEFVGAWKRPLTCDPAVQIGGLATNIISSRGKLKPI
jgi:hypothetical protein